MLAYAYVLVKTSDSKNHLPKKHSLDQWLTEKRALVDMDYQGFA